MRAPALPCKQKAGEEGGGKGKLGMENWKICKVSFRKKVIWNLNLKEINSTVGWEFGGRVPRDKV